MKLQTLVTTNLLATLLSLVPIAVVAEPVATDEQRIISAGASITEILYELGLEENIVAVDSTSLYPPATNVLPKIGYFRSLSAEGLMSLNPSILVAANGAGPSTVLNQISQLGVEVKQYEQAIYTVESWRQLIKEIGNDFDKQTVAENLIKTVIAKIESQQTFEQARKKENITAVMLLSIGQRGPVAAGSNTVPNFLFELTGINNLAAKLDGYKPFSTELLANKKLDLVVIPSHVIDSIGGVQAVCDNPVIKLAMDDCNVFLMDPLLLMGFGPRIDQAMAQLTDKIDQL